MGAGTRARLYQSTKMETPQGASLVGFFLFGGRLFKAFAAVRKKHQGDGSAILAEATRRFGRVRVKNVMDVAAAVQTAPRQEADFPARFGVAGERRESVNPGFARVSGAARRGQGHNAIFL